MNTITRHRPPRRTVQHLLLAMLLPLLMLMAPDRVMPAGKRFVVPDVTLVDHRGRQQRLRSTVMAERVVVMNFIFTDCAATCPVSTAIMKSVHERLSRADLLGQEVVLISVSVNPTVDTPQRLRHFAKEHDALAADWYWLTGSQEHVDRLLLALHTYTAQAREHPNVILVGHGKAGPWTPLYGFPAVDSVVEQVYRYLGKAETSG